MEQFVRRALDCGRRFAGVVYLCLHRSRTVATGGAVRRWVAHPGKVSVQQRGTPAQGRVTLDEYHLLAAFGGFQRRRHAAYPAIPQQGWPGWLQLKSSREPPLEILL